MAMGLVRNIYGDDPKDERFFGELLLSIPVEVTNDPNVVGYLSWDEGKKSFKIVINPDEIFEIFSDFINAPIDPFEGMDEEEIIRQRKVASLRAILKHELLHYALFHWAYKLDGCDKMAANIAQDAVINTMIAELDHITQYVPTVTPRDIISGDVPEKFVLMDDSILITGDSWVDIFEEIKRELDCLEISLTSFNGDYDHVEDHIEDAEKAFKRAAAASKIPEYVIDELKELGKLPGDGTSSLSRIIEIGNSNDINWLSVLKKFFQGMRKFEWHATWKRPSRRFGFPPSMKFRYRESYDVTVMVDVSGSVSSEDLSRALGEVAKLAKLYEVTGWVYTYDVTVHDKIKLENVKRNRIELHGGGGTSLESALEGLKLSGNVIIFTDGYDNSDLKSYVKNHRFLFVYYPNYNQGHKHLMRSLGAWTAVLEKRG